MGLVGAPTYPMLRDATLATLFEILNSNGIPHDFSKAENVLTFKDTRSRILFRAVDEFERLRGTNLAWFGLDELTYTQEAAWLRLEGRLRDPKAKRLCGFAVWTPKGFDWVYRRFVAEPVEGYEAILAKPFENRFLLQQIPDFYDRLKGSYDERFFNQEVLGQYLNVQTGLVYRSFNRDEHVRNLEINRRLPLLWALDFNVDPMCSVVAQIENETVMVVDEIVLPQASTYDACEEFHARYGEHRAGVVVYGDVSGNAKHTTGSSDYHIIREFFRNSGVKVSYQVGKSNPPVRDRVNVMNGKMRSAGGDLQLYVNKKCKELVKDFEQVTFKPDSTIIDKDKDSKRTHLSDALGYLVWEQCRPRARAGEQGKRLV
jgi:hypothetical protein